MTAGLAARQEQWQVNGLTFAGLSWGNAGQRPVLALHGWLDNAASFAVLAPLLEGCHVVALDLSGHGLTDHRSPDASYQIWDDLPEIIGVADQLGWDQFELIGHSRGAIISSLLASAFPDRVRSLALLDAVAPEPLAESAFPTQIRRAIEDKARFLDKENRVFATAEQGIAAREAGGLEASAARLIASRNLENRGDSFAWRTDPRLRGASAVKLTQGQIAAVLQNIHMPTRLFLASDAARRHPQIAQLARQFIPGLDIVEIEGGHHFHMEKGAVEVARKLLALFNGAGGA